jgi:hypothetical protein
VSSRFPFPANSSRVIRDLIIDWVHVHSPGLWATIGAQLLIIVLVATLTLFNKRQNKLLDAGRREPIEGIVGFRYSI